MTRSQECAAAVVAELVAGGVADVVLCPGSRSAPLALAAAAAARAGQLLLHVRVDERGAGFLALGLAKGSLAPVAVITTSGTAAGNLLPAAMEARHAGIPLILVTADRPAGWAWSGANQTTEQRGLFGHFARWEAVVDAAADSGTWAPTARACVGRAVAAPGPAHLNVHLPEPLVAAC